ncbi:unnamed protein product [Rhodiola kirilowii]
MASEEVLKAVFPYLDGKELVSCMLVCKQWKAIAKDDYFWKCVCAKRWPSVCKRPKPPTVTYYKLNKTFRKRQHQKSIVPPKLSFKDLEFFIDIWSDKTLIFSDVIPGPVFLTGIKIPPPGISDMLKFHLEGPQHKMTLPLDPRFKVQEGEILSISVLVGRKDSNKVASIIKKARFDYIDRSAHRAHAFDYLDFASPVYLFITGIRAWFSLLFMEDGNEGVIDVFGLEMDFSDAANTEEEVLCLLDMLEWN